MGNAFKRLAAILLLAAGLTNGLFGPLAHHAMASPAQAPDLAPGIHVSAGAPHAECPAAEADDEGDRSHQAGGEHPGNSGLMCSGSAACCAAVTMLELLIDTHRERIAPRDSRRPVLAGLSPPVGERPPSRV